MQQDLYESARILLPAAAGVSPYLVTIMENIMCYSVPKHGSRSGLGKSVRRYAFRDTVVGFPGTKAINRRRSGGQGFGTKN